ncbi:MAG: hypothetical protein JST58_14620 [Bacteroidetes bacterium]|nr:hypothetical protein [Bacteroidota bacterium]
MKIKTMQVNNNMYHKNIAKDQPRDLSSGADFFFICDDVLHDGGGVSYDGYDAFGVCPEP